MGLSHNSESPNESYTVLFGVWVQSRTFTKNSDPSLCVALTTEKMNGEKRRLRLQELEALDDKRLQAQLQIELYQARISRASNKKVKERAFKKGDLVLAVRRSMVMTHKTKGKFQPK